MAETAILERKGDVLHGRRLEYFTIAWNTLEGLVAVLAGVFATSISLVGFGIDSFIEVTSGWVLLWRMSVDGDAQARERNERRALKTVGACFLALAAYITYESSRDLWSKKAPGHSIPGIVLACVSLIVMPLLSRAKRKVGRALGSAAMHADAKQTEFCAYLSASFLPVCCSTPSSVCGGPTQRLRSSWYPSSQKKESRDCGARPATNAARDNYFFGRSSDIVGVSPV